MTRIALELHQQPDTDHTVQAVAQYALYAVGLSAIDAGAKFVIADTTAEPRWPRWCRRVSELGILSVLSIRLATDSSRVGTLNLYAGTTDRFSDADDVAVGQLLAQHASIALDTSLHIDSLHQAIDGHTVIGQAQGVLMERYDLDADRAFAVLRRYSQLHNTKLAEVARRLTATRTLPD